MGKELDLLTGFTDVQGSNREIAFNFVFIEQPIYQTKIEGISAMEFQCNDNKTTRSSSSLYSKLKKKSFDY